MSLFTQAASEPDTQQTILLADSNPGVRCVLRRTLEKAHYKILETTNGDQALNVCRRYQGPIHLLLSDIGLPGVHGPALARLVTNMRPLTRIVFLTGEPEEANTSSGVCPGCWLLVRKPFRPYDLAQALKKFLRRDSVSSSPYQLPSLSGLVE